MPLTGRVAFRAVFEGGSRVQVPKNVRWGFKLETDQVMRVSVGVVGSFAGKECFYARMRRDGRITIPRVTVSGTVSEEDRASMARL